MREICTSGVTRGGVTGPQGSEPPTLLSWWFKFPGFDQREGDPAPAVRKNHRVSRSKTQDSRLRSQAPCPRFCPDHRLRRGLVAQWAGGSASEKARTVKRANRSCRHLTGRFEWCCEARKTVSPTPPEGTPGKSVVSLTTYYLLFTIYHLLPTSLWPVIAGRTSCLS